mmetsp:Transcript_32486/g.64409  ORF Transcript_32486/g.64409 Transcript_32486/m.64409 type:complete len:107 (+) Transcript_32486:1449-1769(+)
MSRTTTARISKANPISDADFPFILIALYSECSLAREEVSGSSFFSWSQVVRSFLVFMEVTSATTSSSSSDTGESHGKAAHKCYTIGDGGCRSACWKKPSEAKQDKE